MGAGGSKDTVYERTKLRLPDNYEAIVKDVDSPMDNSSLDKLYEQLHAGVFLNQRKKKYWIDEKFKNCFMMFARDLTITWVENQRYWRWLSLKESDVPIDAAELLDVCWLEVEGKFETAKLSPGATYEVAFVVMLKDPSYGWEVPVNLRLTLPDGNKQEHKENLMVKTRGQWTEIPVGEFCNEKMGEIKFLMYEYEGGKWKRGLVIKGVVIRPSSKAVSSRRNGF